MQNHQFSAIVKFDKQKRRYFMRITFIGSSHGVPEPNRKCSCTMIETSGCYYFVDMGTSPIDHLVTAGIPVDAVKGIFITHMHGDHTNGLISFVDLISWYFKTAEPTICLPDIEGAKAIENWTKVTQSAKRNIDYREVQPGLFFDDGFLKVTAIPTRHTECSYSFFLEAEEKSILFTGDLKHPDQDFPAAAKERSTDLIVCESAHFKATAYLLHLQACKTKLVYVNHYSVQRIPSILQLAEELGEIPVKLAYDGSEIIL
jgi:ribonuclease BN (tRNA processing enzyme)